MTWLFFVLNIVWSVAVASLWKVPYNTSPHYLDSKKRKKKKVKNVSKSYTFSTFITLMINKITYSIAVLLTDQCEMRQNWPEIFYKYFINIIWKSSTHFFSTLFKF